MGLFDDLSRFLETRLEEFLQSHPHLELQALEEQLREQEQDTQRLILDLQRQEKKLQDEILAMSEALGAETLLTSEKFQTAIQPFPMQNDGYVYSLSNETLQEKIDLVTKNGLKPRIAERVLSEVIYR